MATSTYREPEQLSATPALPQPASNKDHIAQLRCRFYWPIERILRLLSDEFDREGDVVEVVGYPRRVFCFRNPEHIAAIFKHPEVTHTKLTRILPRVKYLMGQGGYICSKDWKARRELVQAAFKRPYLIRYTDQLPPLTEAMLGQWQAYADSGAVFDLLPELQRLIVRASMKMFFSIDVSGPELDQLCEQTHFIDLNLVRPSPWWVPLPGNLRFQRYAKSVRAMMLHHVQCARKSSSRNEDLLSHLIDLKSPTSGETWSDREIVDEMCSVYFGASVMSTTLAWCFLQLATHPEVQDKLRAEARSALGGRTPTSEDLRRLPYSSKVVQETLRLFPPSWGLPRYCRAGMKIGDYSIPERSVVIPMIMHAQRHPDHWEYANVFRPERFENPDEVDAYAHFPFGRGPRACLGKNLAPMLLRLVSAMIAGRYQLEYASALPADPASEIGFEIHPRDALPFRLRNC